MQFRKYIQPARDRVVAHYDKVTVLSGAPVGAFPAGEDVQLMDTLWEICNTMHKASFGEILGEMVPYHTGDVHDFKKALRQAVAFDGLFTQSKGDELNRLADLLRKVGDQTEWRLHEGAQPCHPPDRQETASASR